MIKIPDWLIQVETLIENTLRLFDAIITNQMPADIEKQLHDTREKVERNYIPEGQKLRDACKEKNGMHIMYKDVQVQLDKLHLLSRALETINAALKRIS